MKDMIDMSATTVIKDILDDKDISQVELVQKIIDIGILVLMIVSISPLLLSMLVIVSYHGILSIL